MPTQTFVLIMIAAYGPLLALQIGLHLHRRSQNKLKDTHRDELEMLRGKHQAEREAAIGRPRVISIAPGASADPYSAAYNQVALPEVLKRVESDLESLKRRLDKLEAANRKSGAA